jgi:acetoin utilization deacetylase AcuC-like enzyme
VVTAVEHVLDSDAGTRALALVRPPGHHAERNRAMGFCFFNNIAIAAASARAHGLSRVAIVDYDVHHGNGTQWSFYHDPSVMFISSHQFPYYPGTGAAGDIGTAAGAGFTINLPLSAGATRRRLRAGLHEGGAADPEAVPAGADFDFRRFRRAHERPARGHASDQVRTSATSQPRLPRWPTSAARAAWSR